MGLKDSDKTLRISKNVVALYFRMVLVTIVSLYTSRIVLHELGVDGYGTYTLVAGIVTFWLFLNGSMTTASTRFLSVAVESNDTIKISRIFSSVFWVHLSLAILFIFLGETVGLWFLLTKLNIIPDLLFEAKVVYQLSIISVTLGILQVPFTSMCIAQERMGIFAVLEILNSTLRLLTAIFLILIMDNKLIVYGSLLLLSAVLIFFCYLMYCKHRFKGDVSIKKYNTTEVKEILSFTTWDLYGNGAVSVRMQGTAVLYNIFINTAANAALGISMQVQGVITTLATNIAMAIRPQITKSYVAFNHNYMEHLVISSTKVMSSMVLLFIVPLVIETPYVLRLWLGSYPEYSIWFTRFALISVYFWTFSTLSHSIIHATGKVKKYSFISGTVVIFEVVIMYVMMKYTRYPYIPQILRIIVLYTLGIVMLMIIRLYIPTYNIRKYLKEIYLFGTLSLIVCFVLPSIVSILLEPGWTQLILVTTVGIIWVSCVVWFLFFKQPERFFCINFLKKIFKTKTL